MKNVIVLVVVLAVIGYVGVQVAGVYQTRWALTHRVEYYLDSVLQSPAQVKEDLVREAREKGVELKPADIQIVSQDTDIRSIPQKMLEKKIAQFQNKQITIAVAYDARILGFNWRQEISCSKIKQVAAQSRERRDYEEATKPVPGF
jgi:Tfp pilus assembly protein PilN